MNYERTSTIKDLYVFRAFRLWSPFSHFSHTLFTRKTKATLQKKEERKNYGLIFKQEILWAHKYVSANCLPASMGMCSVEGGGGGVFGAGYSAQYETKFKQCVVFFEPGTLSK